MIQGRRREWVMWEVRTCWFMEEKGDVPRASEAYGLGHCVCRKVLVGFSTLALVLVFVRSIDV